MAERTNPHTEIVVGARDDASPVFDKIKGSAQGMAAGVEQSAKKAGDSVGGIGDKAQPAAGKVDGATKSIIQSIERATAAMKAGEKGTASYFEALAKQRGVSGDALTPYIAALREAEVAQKAAILGQQGMALSAKQTAAALRGVPAQITDIIVSLQGGQAPMTVLLQQGGQLKDMFGGIAPAAKALGGAVLGLVNPFTIAAAAGVGLAVAYNQGRKEAEAFNKTLILSGNAAGTSADSLSDMARAIDATSNGITQSKAAEVLNSIAASGDVAAYKLQRYAQVAIEFERAGGGAADEVAKAFSSLAGDPLKAVEKLNKSTNFLTAEIYNQIKALEDEGRSTDAARVAQDAYASMLDQRIPKLKDNLGLLERGWMGVKDAAAEAWDSMLNVGRAQTIGGRLEAAQKLLADYESTLPGKRTTEQVARVAEAGGVDGLRSQIAGLKELMETQRKADEQQRANNQSTQAAINLSKQASQFDTDLEKQRKAVAQATELYTTALAAGNLSEAARAQLEKDYLKTVSGITAAKEQRATSTRKENKDLADQSRIFAELAGVSSTYYKELAAAQAQRAKGNISEAQYIAYVEELIQKQPFAVALVKEETDANKALSKSYAEAAAERIKTIQSMERAADSLQSQNDALRDEIQLIGLSATEQMEVIRLREEAVLLVKEQHLAEMARAEDLTGTMTRERIALEREIELRRERLNLMGDKATKEQFAESNREMNREWQRTVDQYGDVFRQGFADMLNNGKDGWKSFTRSLVTTFKTTVADQIYKMFAQPFVVKIVGSLLGVTGASAANAATGGGGLMGMASNASSAYNLISSGMNIAASAGKWLATSEWTSLGGEVVQEALGQFGAGMMNTASWSAATQAFQAGGAQMAGVIAGSVLNGFAGYGISSALSGGYSAGGWVNTAAGIASMIPGVGPIAGVVGGAVNRLFGRKHTQTNLQGTFGGPTGFEGQWEDYYKGGWLRSGKSVYTPLEEETRSALADQFNLLKASTTAMSAVLGSGADAIADFTFKVNIKLKDLSPEEAEKAIQAEMDKVAEALAKAQLDAMGRELMVDYRQIDRDIIGGYDESTLGQLEKDIAGWKQVLATGIRENGEVANKWVLNWVRDAIAKGEAEISRLSEEMWKPFAKAGETAAETLTRLSGSIVTVVDAFKLLDVQPLYQSEFASSLQGGKNASDYLDKFGGKDTFSQLVAGYYDAFYTEAEKTANVTESITAALAMVNLTMPATREEFRALTNEYLAMGMEGADTAKVLLQVSGAFASVTPATEEAAVALETVDEALARLRAGVERTAEDIAQSILDLERETSDLQIELLRAQGDIAGADAAQRLIDTAGMTEAEIAVYNYNKSLRKQIDAIEAAQTAIQKLAERVTEAFNAMNQAGALLDRINAAVGRPGDTYSQMREQRLWAAMSEASYEQQIELAGQLTDIVLSRYQVESQASQKQLDFARSLRDYVESLKIGSLSPLTNAQKLAEASQQYASTLDKARAGDEKAMGSLQGAASSYLELARVYFASSEDYTSIFNNVTGALDSLGVTSQSDAERQLSVSSESLGELTKLRDILEGAYASAEAEYTIQKELLQEQIDYASRTAAGVEAMVQALGGLSAEMGIRQPSGSIDIAGLAGRWTELMSPYGLTKSSSQVAAELSTASLSDLQREYAIGQSVLTTDAQRAEWDYILSQLTGGIIKGSHANGLDYVPFDGYIAQLHKGERVLTERENISYSRGSYSDDSTAELVAEVRSLRAEVSALRRENREDAQTMTRATVVSNQQNAELIVNVVGEATSRAAYAKTLESKATLR